ncbi:MAG TPA: AtpZ/AtpI family protein [Methyloceanibacter sp.]|jgi:ATP synthase protein I
MAGAKDGRNKGDRDNEHFRQRLDELGERIGKARGNITEREPVDAESRGRALGQALRLATELVVGVGVGGVIGWGLDRILGTAPFLLVGFLTLGAAAGILNVMRTAKAMQPKGPLPGKDLGPDDDDD